MLLRRMSQVSVKRVKLVIAGLQCKDFLWFVCDIFDIPALTESHTILITSCVEVFLPDA